VPPLTTHVSLLFSLSFFSSLLFFPLQAHM
jgi:hypothetical protein